MRRMLYAGLLLAGLLALTSQTTVWAAGAFTGTVVDSATGAPVEGAAVILSRYALNPEILDTCLTDAEGVYGFDSLLTGRRNPYTLTVQADSYGLAVKSNLTLASNQLDTVDFLLVLPDTTTPPGPVYGAFTGKISDSVTADPIAGALVILSARINFAWETLDSSLTDADGRYHFAEVTASATIRYALSVSVAGYVPESRTSLYADSGVTDTVDFPLNALDTTNSWLLSGFVTSDSLTGSPLARAAVEVVQKTGTEFRYAATTDNVGYFEVLVLNIARTYLVTASLTGYQPRSITINVAEDSTEANLFLAPETLTTAVDGSTKGCSGIEFSVSPNPANAGAAVRYVLSAPSQTRIALYGVDGRLIRLLSAIRAPQGEHSVQMNTRGIPAGVYLLKAEMDNRQFVRRLTIRR